MQDKSDTKISMRLDKRVAPILRDLADKQHNGNLSASVNDWLIAKAREEGYINDEQHRRKLLVELIEEAINEGFDDDVEKFIVSKLRGETEAIA